MTEDRAELAATFFLPVPHRPGVGRDLALLACSVAAVAGGTALFSARDGYLAGVSSLLLVAGAVGFCFTLMHTIGWVLRYRVAVRRSRRRPTGVQMDHWLAAGVEQSVERAARRLGAASTAARCLTVVGVPDLTTGRNDVADGHFSVYEILVVHLIDDRCVLYSETLEMRTGQAKAGTATERPLAQIEAVGTVVRPLRQQLRAPSSLGAAMEPVDWLRGGEVTGVRVMQFLSGGRPVTELVVGVALGRATAPVDVGPEPVDVFVHRLSEAIYQSGRSGIRLAPAASSLTPST
ncbi:hypothetical protein F4553_001002 [Allocatelliglobosispora scoriae]|uniref:Uncharacterized protein n=1 Tax=Allocatelliglobosispora scoriae TaxID=643052 RepID=A0A841BKV1_9ACTN|nr:hypothetical protein [Allocatelliglobosispora scoriae]MBB5867623.1 hypothetical protein [Allocatelliglobosispora scoriae]